MANQIIILKNNTPRILSFTGKDLAIGEQYSVSYSLQNQWKDSDELFDLVGCGDIIVSDGVKDLLPTEGWKWFLGNGGFPKSEIGNKIWVHSSAKPVIEGKNFYSQWIGTGDDEANHLIGEGPLTVVQNTIGTPMSFVEMRFDQANFGDVYVHEGFMMWENAKIGDYINAFVVAEGSHVQQSINLDLVISEDGWVSYSPSGPGTGSHGFVSTPYLVARTFSKDGDWDYNEAEGLRPNFTKTGNYKISIHEKVVHRFMHKLPVLGTNTSPMRLVSEDSLKLPHGYFLRVECHNMSNTEWTAAFIITAYKERTCQ